MAALDQVLRNSAAELAATFFVDGVATDADANVTVTVYSPDGTVFDGPVTADDATPGDGTYEYDLSPQANLTELQLDWTGLFGGISQTVTTYVEIVGGFLFTIKEARDFRGGKLSDATKYPTADIIDVREEISQLFEKFTQVSFAPRFRRETQDGSGGPALYLDRREVTKILSLTEDGTALVEGTDFHAYRSGRLLRNGDAVWSTEDPRNVVVEYEHGFQLTPGPIARAALIVLHSYLIGSDIFDRKVSQTDETGTFRLSFPDASRDRPTGIPYVDARLNEYLDPWGVA